MKCNPNYVFVYWFAPRDDKTDVASLELFRKELPYAGLISKRLSFVKKDTGTILSFWRSLAIFAEKDENKELIVRQLKLLAYIPETWIWQWDSIDNSGTSLGVGVPGKEQRYD